MLCTQKHRVVWEAGGAIGKARNMRGGLGHGYLAGKLGCGAVLMVCGMQLIAEGVLCFWMLCGCQRMIRDHAIRCRFVKLARLECAELDTGVASARPISIQQEYSSFSGEVPCCEV